MRHINIPIFIPHLGCPNQCVFCNQRTISGQESFDLNAVAQHIEGVLATAENAECEIAFFGGSFTGIDRDLMISLLEIAYGYVLSGRVASIRCSTRPDYIDDEVLQVLKKYGVKTVELGIQSISDSVLSISKRGHDFEATRRASKLVIDNGFSLVGQMMVGLPTATLFDEIKTAEFIVSVGATAARIYPTVVFKDTELCSMAGMGEYIPLSVDEAVYRSAKVYGVFLNAGVKVIRVGLCASENLTDEDKYYGGPNHSALGELVENEVYYSLIKKEFESLGETSGRIYNVFVPRGAMSKAIGQRKKNRIRLTQEFSLKDIRFIEDDTIDAFSIRLEQERNRAGCT